MEATPSLPTLTPPPTAAMPRAPFLRWPVSRREFYRLLAVALLPTLAWGMIIFGWRAWLLIASTVAGAVFTHAILRRFTARGARLEWSHTVASALLIASLAWPLWPAPVLLGAGLLLPLLIWMAGGPGYERVHAALFIAVALALLLPTRAGSAILVHGRLFNGDLTDAVEHHRPLTWPRDSQVNYHDAVLRPMTRQVLSDLRTQIAPLLHDPAQAQAEVERSLLTTLPRAEHIILGARPGSIGAVSVLAILIGGLLLAYRHILRMQSTVLFLVAVNVVLLVLPVAPRGVGDWKDFALSGLWRLPPPHALLMLSFELMTSDFLLAAVFLIALPGTVPITRVGRRWFLLVAAFAAAFLSRMDVVSPATLTLLVLHPLAPGFDALFARRSWLGRAKVPA